MALARCSGCDVEGMLRLVTAHQRTCEKYAELCRVNFAAAMVDPLEVFRAAHAGDEAPVVQRPRASKSAGSAPVARVPGSVAVEYWAWNPTLLETLGENA